jgi:hypothetical protein
MPQPALTLLGGFQARLGPGAPLALPAKVQVLLACRAILFALAPGPTQA